MNQHDKFVLMLKMALDFNAAIVQIATIYAGRPLNQKQILVMSREITRLQEDYNERMKTLLIVEAEVS